VSAIVLTNAFVFCHGYDFTSDINQVSLESDVNLVEVTTFGSGGWKEFKPGLKDLKFSERGFWASAASASPDTEAFPDLAIADRVFTVGPAATAGEVAYLFQGAKTAYSLLGADVGEAAPFTLAAVNTDQAGVVRGALAAAKGNVSATGALGSALNLGAPTSSQYVYATLHVFSAGTTITVQVQSDDNSGMSSPTSRGTIGPLTTAGGTWMTRIAGPFAGETWWRLNVSSVTGTFQVAGAVGIG
jgi:hypothetical protein